jgi:uridylate kinase
MVANAASAPLYNRALLKLSGEALLGAAAYGIDADAAIGIAREIHSVSKAGTQICVVVGGGNIFRGLAGVATGMDRAKADYIGMLATLMNAIALANALERIGAKAVVHTAIPADAVARRFNRDESLNDL